MAEEGDDYLREIVAKEGKYIELGRKGENLATRVVFDIGSWRSTYGDGIAQLVFQRNGDKYPYPCVISVDGSKVYWEITNTETEMSGRGSAELRYLADDVVVKSAIFTTRTLTSMGVTGDTPPDPIQNWLDKLLEIGASAEENSGANAVAAQLAAENALAASKAAEAAAQEAKDLANEILAGDYCTRPEAQAYANTAESNAKNYADAQIEAAIGAAIGGSY